MNERNKYGDFFKEKYMGVCYQFYFLMLLYILPMH